jgi:hypothetical protein
MAVCCAGGWNPGVPVEWRENCMLKEMDMLEIAVPKVDQVVRHVLD